MKIVLGRTEFDSDGLPAGNQFMTRACDEDVCVAICRVYQDGTDWRTRLPSAVDGGG